jgi:hypothetical protein
MQLSAQQPHIQNLPAFLKKLAESLERLHNQKEAHGFLFNEHIVGWMGDSGDLDAGKLLQARAPAAKLPQGCDPLHFDVRCFADIAIGFIAGPSEAADAPFQAFPFSGKEWPDAFLLLLENVTKAGEQDCLTTMADLSHALQQPAAKAAIATPEPGLEASPEHANYTGSYTAPGIKPSTAQPAIRIALRNATVGKPYSYEPGKIAAAIAAQLGNDPAQAYISHLQLPDDCGLVFDKATGALSGIPTRAFDQELSLDYVPSQSARSISAKVTLLINPDPASLWKELSPPADAPYQKPILDHREEQHGPFRIVAASRRGRSHANKGEFRDDDFAIGYAAESGWLVIVVADGAGSAAYSRRGSQVASAAACDRLIAVLNNEQHNQAEALFLQHRDWQHPEVKKAIRQTLYEAALVAHHKLRDEVKAPAEAITPTPVLRNYDTTLILLAMKRVGEGVLAATFAIGDGGAGILSDAKHGFPLTKADSGEHAGQTIFLTFDSTVANTEANLESRFHLVQTEEFVGALAMTDGITDPKFPSDAAFADPQQWAALWAELQAPLSSSADLLDWMNFFSPGNHDDRTLVAVLPAQSASPAKP